MELAGIAFAFVALIWVVLHHLRTPPLPKVSPVSQDAIDALAAIIKANDERVSKCEIEVNTVKSALVLKQSFAK